MDKAQIEQTIREHQDSFGLIHHIKNPDPASSTNAILFTASTYVLLNEHGFNVENLSKRAIEEVKVGDKYSAYSKRVTTERIGELSHDNYKGLLALHYLAGIKLPFLFMKRAHLRPDNFCLLIYSYLDQRKLTLLGLPFLLIYSLSLFISAMRKFKYRNGKKTIRASNKQMAYMVCKALNLKLTFKICTLLIKRNSEFGSWHNVFYRYYTGGHAPNPHHPTILISGILYGKDKNS